MTTTKKPSAPVTTTAWLKSQPDTKSAVLCDCRRRNPGGTRWPGPRFHLIDCADLHASEAAEDRAPHPLSTLTERRFAEHLASIHENRHPGTRAATLAEVERIVLDAWDLVEALDGVRALMTAMQSQPPAQAPRDMTADEARDVTARMPRPGR